MTPPSGRKVQRLRGLGVSGGRTAADPIPEILCTRTVRGPLRVYTRGGRWHCLSPRAHASATAWCCTSFIGLSTNRAALGRAARAAQPGRGRRRSAGCRESPLPARSPAAPSPAWRGGSFVGSRWSVGSRPRLCATIAPSLVEAPHLRRLHRPEAAPRRGAVAGAAGVHGWAFDRGPPRHPAARIGGMHHAAAVESMEARFAGQPPRQFGVGGLDRSGVDTQAPIAHGQGARRFGDLQPHAVPFLPEQGSRGRRADDARGAHRRGRLRIVEGHQACAPQRCGRRLLVGAQVDVAFSSASSAMRSARRSKSVPFAKGRIVTRACRRACGTTAGRAAAMTAAPLGGAGHRPPSRRMAA